jgi:guanylate kinase
LSAEPFIAVLIGPGGVGKGTLARQLVAADDALWLSKSWTTRPVRTTEDGSEYHFVDRGTFERAIKNDEFLEWAEFHGNLYGTPRPQPPEGAEVLLEIEVQGAEQVLERVPSSVVFLIVAPSIEHLEERLRGRGDSDEHVATRLSSAPEEMVRGQKIAQYVIVNDDVQRSSGEILSILEELRQQRRTPSIKD